MEDVVVLIEELDPEPAVRPAVGAPDVRDLGAVLAAAAGPGLHVYGSANLLQTLLAHDLVDGLWLRIHPITLGRGSG